MEQGGSSMYQVDHSKANKTGKIRVRVDNGHNTYYKKLENENLTLLKEISLLDNSDRSQKKEINNKNKIISANNTKMEYLRKIYEKPIGVEFYAPRYSLNVQNEDQAKYVDNLFKEQKVYHEEGRDVPREILEKLKTIGSAPERNQYISYLASVLIDLSGYKLEQDVSRIYNVPEDIFEDQSNISQEYIDFHAITMKEIIEESLEIIENPITIDLKGKKYIFTSAPASYTAIELYFKLLYNLGKRHNVDGFIFVGPWSKTIFLHKRSSSNTILDSVKKLIRDFKVFSLRSNLDVAEIIPDLTDLGVTFLDTIEDDKNIFLGYQLTHTSSKDPLSRFRDFDKDKNIFVYSPTVTFETRIYKNNIHNIVGSGSSSINLPRCRRTTTGYDSQFMNSMKYDSTGGHILNFDESGNLHCSTFHYNRVLKGILVNGELIKESYSATPPKCDLSVIVSDMHVQHMNINSFKALLHFLDTHRENIKRFVLNGDFFDNVILSHWKKDKILDQIKDNAKIPSFLHEIAYARKILKLILEKLNPETELIYKMGNHEVNSINKILQQPLMHALSNILDLENLLDLKNLGFRVINSRESYLIAGIDVFHGHEMNRVKGRKVFGRNNASGHIHRCSIDNDGVSLPGMQDPTSADFMPYFKQSWANGWAIINEYKGVGDKPEIILLSDEGVFNNFNSLQDSKQLEEIDLSIEKELTITYKLV